MIDVTLPQLGESVSEGTVSKWLVREGEVVRKDQPLVSISTDKADAEVPSPVAGRIVQIVVHDGDVIAVNAVLCRVEEGVSESAPPASARPAPPSVPVITVSATGAALATPTVRKAALERDVNIDTVKGSGERGRITKDDVLRAATPPPPLKKVTSPAPAAPGGGYGSFKVPPYKPSEGDEVIPFTRRRRITADHMTYSKLTSPHVVTVAEVDLHKASKVRDAHKDRYKKEGHSLTMLAFVVVAAARALRETPQLNARVLDDAYVILRDINIGVAVDSPDGLVVPVIRRADELGVRGIVRAIDDVAKRARAGKITIDDLSGATFSISNPGMKGNLFGGAIINQPNVGILRMGEIQKKVVVVTNDGEDQMVIHPVMYIALSYDHRVVDGVAANAFLWRTTELLELADFEV